MRPPFWRYLRRTLDSLRALSSVAERLRVLEVEAAQIRTLLKEVGCAPPPPPHLQVRVVGVHATDFFESGQSVVSEMDALLARNGMALTDFQRILDLGCGCGRVLRALHPRVCAEARSQLYGADIDAEAIAWLQANLGDLARFSVNQPLPPLPYDDGFFDFVFGISLFTHLPEDLQFHWLREIRRVVRPGGLVLLTFHGGSHFERAPARQKDDLRRRGFAYAQTGATPGLPDFYQTAWHTAEYVAAEWGKLFEVLDVQANAIGGHQDAALCRNTGPGMGPAG